eukprot:3833058-Prymnesium_polylepis.1
MVRFSRDEIYTFCGSVLLAVNPYKFISQLCAEDVMNSYEHLATTEMPPHVYAIVERAYRKACHGGGSQSLIISGESGAGKTESTKIAISYLVWRSHSESRQQGSASNELTNSTLQRRILQANPLLEALGNAATTRNVNSSRFGKCVRLAVDPSSGSL